MCLPGNSDDADDHRPEFTVNSCISFRDSRQGLSDDDWTFVTSKCLPPTAQWKSLKYEKSSKNRICNSATAIPNVEADENTFSADEWVDVTRGSVTSSAPPPSTFSEGLEGSDWLSEWASDLLGPSHSLPDRTRMSYERSTTKDVQTEIANLSEAESQAVSNLGWHQTHWVYDINGKGQPPEKLKVCRSTLSHRTIRFKDKYNDVFAIEGTYSVGKGNIQMGAAQEIAFCLRRGRLGSHPIDVRGWNRAPAFVILHLNTHDKVADREVLTMVLGTQALQRIEEQPNWWVSEGTRELPDEFWRRQNGFAKALKAMLVGMFREILIDLGRAQST